MKEIVNVSISGIAFTVDKECFAMLNNFLQSTQHERGSEIASEVEASIAEQILSVQPADRPISMPLLREILERIGGVEISATPLTDEQSAARTKVTKRLYRKGEGAVLGGVCNGMAVYFNVHVALIRILFLIPFLTSVTIGFWHWVVFPNLIGGLSGTFFMLYLILWIVIPKARSARQILEMEGEDVTLESLGRKASEALSVNKNSAPTAFGTIIRVVGVIFGSFMMLCSVVALIAMLFSSQHAYMSNQEVFDTIFHNTGMTLGWFQLWAAAVIMLPAIGFFNLLISSAFGRVRGWLLSLIFGLWILLLIAAAVWVAIYSPDLMQINSGYDFHWRWHC